MTATIIPGPGGDQGSSSTSSGPGLLGLPSNKEFFLWGISGLALIALADPYPNMAIFFMWLLIAGVLLINSQDYISLLQSAGFGG